MLKCTFRHTSTAQRLSMASTNDFVLKIFVKISVAFENHLEKNRLSERPRMWMNYWNKYFFLKSYFAYLTNQRKIYHKIYEPSAAERQSQFCFYFVSYFLLLLRCLAIIFLLRKQGHIFFLLKIIWPCIIIFT